MKTNREEVMTYRVIVNSEGWYAICPADHENPPGWDAAGGAGTEAECLAHIRELLRSAGRAAEVGEGPEHFIAYSIKVIE